MRQPPNHARGFTLIELLVVLVIIGCLVAITQLATSNHHGRAVQAEAERLAALIGVLSEEATLDNREYGLQLNEQSYRVLRYHERQARWQTVADYPPHPLPAFVRLQLSLEGQPLKLAAAQPSSASQAQTATAARLLPQLLMLSNGELSAFSLRIEERAAQGQVFSLTSNGFELPLAERLAP